MRKFYIILLLTAIFGMLTCISYAQVTTSGLSGKIFGKDKVSLPGATVVAVHLPSGTQYGTSTNADGYYRIPNMRIGGPYKITISYVGYKPSIKEDVVLSLGQTFTLNETLLEVTSTLKGVEIVANRNALIDGNRTGASTNINNQQIQALPSINRSINDFTRLNAQTSASGSFAGSDGRYNNITIDGANFNNNFGLSTKNLPGGDAQPISLDAIEEISVNIAPFDIRQSNFTGANINAVTRSGDNQFKGSAYGFYRDKSFNGDKVSNEKLSLSKTTTKTMGARFGGPIIKDKLFFFANFESEESTFPGIPWSASTDGVGDSKKFISRTSESDLETMKQFLITNYGYDPGSYKGFGDFKSKNHKILGRIDWNINKNNKLTVRYNYVKSTNDQQVNATSAPGTRSNFGRISLMSMAFDKSNYGLENTVGSITAELNSLFGTKFANKFLVAYTKIRDTRTTGGDLFPFVDIYKDGNPYMSFGTELFSYQNDVKNNVLTFTDNFNYYLGRHTFTTGISYDYLYFGNSYKRYGTSYYRYASMEDFMTGQAPTTFGLTYPYAGAGSGYAELNFGMGSFYLQDEYQLTDNFKLTGGLRFELPMYLDNPKANAAIDALTFQDLNGNPEKLDVGSWPDSKLLISPRISFNWDVKADQSLQVRGGSGIFTGKLPFVWFTNQPTNSGTLQNTLEITDSASLSTLLFNKDPFHYVSSFPQQPSSVAPGSIAVVAKDFKMPQVWRNDLAADIKLPWWDLVFTAEGIYSKDINAIVQRNANQAIPVGKFAGADNRPKFTAAEKKINSKVSNAIVLYNTNKGYSYSLSVQLTKPPTNGFFGSISYTYFNAKDLTANPGSSASSAWGSNPTVISQNDPDLSFSQFAVPHRVVGSISYRAEYLKHLGTTITLLYEGSHQGRISCIYSNDMNGDGNSADLMYIPKDGSEIHFSDIKNSAGKVLFTADQQLAALFNLIYHDKYLNDHKGEYAKRNAFLLPWLNRCDVRILQDIFTNIGERKSTLQISLDLLNFGNLLNKDWGIRKQQCLGSYDLSLLKYDKVDANNVPYFQMNTIGGKLPTSTTTNVLSTTSTWGAQIGLRYTF